MEPEVAATEVGPELAEAVVVESPPELDTLPALDPAPPPPPLPDITPLAPPPPPPLTLAEQVAAGMTEAPEITPLPAFDTTFNPKAEALQRDIETLAQRLANVEDRIAGGDVAALAGAVSSFQKVVQAMGAQIAELRNEWTTYRDANAGRAADVSGTVVFSPDRDRIVNEVVDAALVKIGEAFTANRAPANQRAGGTIDELFNPIIGR